MPSSLFSSQMCWRIFAVRCCSIWDIRHGRDVAGSSGLSGLSGRPLGGLSGSSVASGVTCEGDGECNQRSGQGEC